MSCDWDPDEDPDWDWVTDGVPGCKFCAIGGVRTHAHWYYLDRWLPLIEVQLPPSDQGEHQDDQDRK